MNWIWPRISFSIRKTFTDACLHRTMACWSHCEAVCLSFIRPPFFNSILLSTFFTHIIHIANWLVHLLYILYISLFIPHALFILIVKLIYYISVGPFQVHLRVAGLLFGICAAFEEAIEQMNDVQAIFAKKAMLRDWKEGISMAHGDAAMAHGGTCHGTIMHQLFPVVSVIAWSSSDRYP